MVSCGQLGPTWGHLGALERMIDDIVIVWRRQTLGVEVEEQSTKVEDVPPKIWLIMFNCGQQVEDVSPPPRYDKSC